MRRPRLFDPFARGLSYFPQVKGRWLKGVLCVLPDSALVVGLPMIVAHVLNGVTRDVDPMPLADVVGWAILFMVLVLVKGAAKFGMRWYITGASREFERIYRQDLFDHIVTLTPHDLQGVRTGDIMSRSVADLEAVRMLLGPSFMYVMQALVIVPAALGVIAWVDPIVCLAMLVPFSGLAVAVWVSAGPTQRWSHEVQERIAELSVVAQENYSGIRVVKAFATEALSGSVFERMGKAFLRANVRLATIRGMTWSSISAIKDLALLVVLGVGGWRLVEGAISYGHVLLFVELLAATFWPLIAIGWMLGLYTRAKSGAARIDEIFAITPTVAEPAAPAPLRDVRGELSVERLDFAYDGTPVLADIALRVPAGGTLGITGRTGSGKTTLVKLLSRQIEPPPGTVFLDGVDVRTLSFDDLRRAVGVVPQDTFLFSESIRDNIAFAGEHIDHDAVETVAGIAQVDKDIQEFNDGYDEMLGERGVTLSGGQRQRTAIARTLAADTPVIILDDCLSAVDSVTEQAILGRLRDTLKDRTAVIVSHRVAALALADRIVVLDEGRVAEEGTHGELIAAGGLYATIHERQSLEAEIETL